MSGDTPAVSCTSSDNWRCVVDASYSDIANKLGMTEPAARMAASRLRGRYRELLHDEISQTVATPEDIDDEIKHLFAVFAR